MRSSVERTSVPPCLRGEPSARIWIVVPKRDGIAESPAMALDGIIFDLDGTLVDTNQVHVEAWRRTFAAHGYKVAPDRIFIEIGKGGDHLVPDILGRDADAADGEALRA